MSQMPRDIEELLRESLQARAQDVEPNPETWTRVQSRIRRGRTFRLALAGVTTAAAVLVAVAVVPGLIDRPDVVFPGPSTPTDPDGDPAPQPVPAPDCDQPTGIAATYVREGDIWAMCVDGGARALYESSPTELNPAFTHDVAGLVFESWRDELPHLVHVDLATGAEQVLGGGELPTFSPDGRFAYVQQADGDHPRILVGELFSEPTEEIVVQHELVPGPLRVRRLAWDTVDDYLLYETVDHEGDSRVWAVEVSTGRHEVLEPHSHMYFSPAVGPDGTIAVLSTESSRDVLRLGYLDRSMLDGAGPAYTDLAPLIPNVHPEMDGLYLAAAGYVWVEGGSWVDADQLAWIVGGDDDMWLVNEEGEMIHLQGGTQAMAVNPAADLGPPEEREPLALEPQSVPQNVAITRQRIHAAARAGDFGGLHALMDPEFSWSFGGNLDRDEAIEHLRANPELLDVIAGLLELPYGVNDPVEPEYFVWPWLFTDPEANWPEFRDQLVAAVGERQVAGYEEHGEYLGWRVGIDRDGTWIYFIAGD